MTGRLVLVAASGLAREIAASADDWEVVGYLDDNPALKWPSPLLGPVSAAAQFEDCMFVVCAGSGVARRSIVERIGLPPERFATVVHPSVHIPPGCSLGPGSVVLAQSVLSADITVGSHTVLMPHVVLTHDDVIGDFVTLCAGVTLGGGVVVEDGAYVGMNASVREHLRLGAESVLGMGSVALQSIPGNQTWVGAPAGPLRHRGSGAA